MPKEVVLIHQRMYYNHEHTMGYIIFGGMINYILEDPKRSEKVKGKTRIPPGLYELKFRKVVTPLTKKYRERYDWFKYHIELQNVKNFNYVYDHIGNYAEDTDGCRLHGMEPTNPALVKKAMVKQSRVAFKRYYEYVTSLLEKGVKVYTLVKNEVTF